MFEVLFATAKRNHRVIKRAFPWTLIFGRFVGAAYIALFSYFAYFYMFRKQISWEFSIFAGNIDFFTYAVLGASMQVFATAILMNVGRALITEIREGTFENLILSPASRKQYLLGNLFEQSLRATSEAILIILLGFILGARFIHFDLIQVGFVWVITVFCLFSMSVILAAIMLYTRDTYITQNTLFFLMNFICGVSFPIKFLPKWVQVISHLLPFSSSLQLYRNVIILGKPIIVQSNIICEILILSISYMVIGFWWISKNEKLFIEKAFG